MTRYFNTEGVCKPKEHYMVRLDARLKAIKEPFADGRDIWTPEGVQEAVQIMLRSKTTLFDHLAEYPDLKKMLYSILFQGEQVAYNQYNHTIELARMFGYITEDGMYVQVANRMFETCLYNLFLSEEELANVMSKLAGTCPASTLTIKRKLA